MELQTAIEKLSEFIKGQSSGITNSDVEANLKDYSPEIRLGAVNELIKQNKIEIMQKGSILIYRHKDPAKQSTQEMDNDEKVIYSIIESGGNTGIWVKDIRVKSNLAMQPLNKILRNMENRNLIKSVKSVNASKKKVYMLFDVEPARSITGGAWYQDSDFETEFVDVLNSQCLRFLTEKRSEAQKSSADGPMDVLVKSMCSVSEVLAFIINLKISKIELNEEDIECILDTVVYDGKAEKIIKAEGIFFKAKDSLLPIEFGLTQVPCGICPVINSCSDSVGNVTPKTCVYMKEWLE